MPRQTISRTPIIGGAGALGRAVNADGEDGSGAAF